MTQLAALSIIAMTVGLSLGRPRLGRFRLDHAAAALLGAGLTVLLGVGPPSLLLDAARFLAAPLLTIVSLMVMTQVAEKAGLFQIVADFLARRARGSASRLLAYIFIAGTLVGTLFTNDAAVLIFTPVAFNLIDRVGHHWPASSRIPFYFAALYAANLVGALVIANPINLVVAGLLDISFLEFAAWMALPALASMVVSFYGLKLFFREDLPRTLAADPAPRPDQGRPSRALQLFCVFTLALTLCGFFAEKAIGAPTVLVAVEGAAVLLVLYKILGGELEPILIRGVSWDVLIFMAGMFAIGLGLQNVGLTRLLGGAIAEVAGGLGMAMRFVTGGLAAISSALINNHPTADLMAFTIRDLALPAQEQKWLGFAALIGGDLGPKMLPIGSLAALIWFRLLRDRGIEVPYSLYVRIGVPVTLAALLAALVVLELQIRLAATAGM